MSIASEWFYLLPWWLSFFFLGLLAYPLTSVLLSPFVDRGYAFAKVIALVFISYVTLVLVFARWLTFGLPSIFCGIILLALTACLFRQQYKYLIEKYYIFIFEEVLFSLIFLAWAYVRSTDPSIRNLEKFMDFGFIQSILKGTYLPPIDIWHPPQTLNYYYFSHLMVASVTKLSLVPSQIAYNLMVATVVALLTLGTFSLGVNLQYLNLCRITLQRPKWKFCIFAGLLSSFVVVFAGNLQDIYIFFEKNATLTPFWQLRFNLSNFPNAYYFADATRFIKNTIHEFPLYSAVVADLHPHFVNLPLVLFAIAYGLCQFMKRPLTFVQLLFSVMILSFWLTCVFLTNPIDLAIYIWPIILLITYHIYKSAYQRSSKMFLVLISFSILFGLFFLLTTPFRTTFTPFANQIGIQCAKVGWEKIPLKPFFFDSEHCEHSPLWQLGLLYGMFFYWGLFFSVLIKSIGKKISAIDKYILLVFIFSLTLIIVPEVFYFKDIYSGFFRANTMFKFSYQAFTLLGLASAYTIFRFLTIKYSPAVLKSLWGFGLFTLILPALYPIFAITQYYPELADSKGLDGMRYLEKLSKGDYNALRWLNKHVKGQPVILEALELDYSDTMRVSALTGIPTVQGWIEHEWLWRGDPDELRQREQQIRTMYESYDLELTRRLLNLYQVKYVFVGKLEYKLYPQLKRDKFQSLGKRVFENDSTEIYKLS